ncbi:hypothetical protein KUTeg_006538 [Tegillarca granosa]|uniref:VWFD domain-containing protein n=1 Tax=Tegillarca granosa TaxID=220873 RepID=A0ABQ9FF34_TEGGR|nr:hypothetical protein KUTeg_006538 [Tegillarca granosa]
MQADGQQPVISQTLTVTFCHHLKVKVDGRLTQLPYKSSEVEIKQEGETVKINGRGFSVVSDIPRERYDINVSGWYFGKTGGLLGTLNNERHDDLMMSNKKTTTDVNALVDSWEVDSNCK